MNRKKNRKLSVWKIIALLVLVLAVALPVYLNVRPQTMAEQFASKDWHFQDGQVTAVRVLRDREWTDFKNTMMSAEKREQLIRRVNRMELNGRNWGFLVYGPLVGREPAPGEQAYEVTFADGSTMRLDIGGIDVTCTVQRANGHTSVWTKREVEYEIKQARPYEGKW